MAPSWQLHTLGHIFIFLPLVFFKEYASKLLLPKKFPAQKPMSPIITSNFPSQCYGAHQTEVYPIVQLNSK